MPATPANKRSGRWRGLACLVKSRIFVYNTPIMNMYGQDKGKHDKRVRLFGIALAVIVILSMIFSYFALVV